MGQEGSSLLVYPTVYDDSPSIEQLGGKSFRV